MVKTTCFTYHGLMAAGANARAGDDDFPRIGRRGSDSGADSRIAALRDVGRACAALLSRTAHLHPHPHPLLTTTTDCLPVVFLRPSLLVCSLILLPLYHPKQATCSHLDVHLYQTELSCNRSDRAAPFLQTEHATCQSCSAS